MQLIGIRKIQDIGQKNAMNDCFSYISLIVNKISFHNIWHTWGNNSMWMTCVCKSSTTFLVMRTWFKWYDSCYMFLQSKCFGFVLFDWIARFCMHKSSNEFHARKSKTHRIKSFFFDNDVELRRAFEGEESCSFVIWNILQRFIRIIRSDQNRHSAHPIGRYSIGNNNCQLNFC